MRIPIEHNDFSRFDYEFINNRIYIYMLKKTKLKIYVMKVLNENHKKFLVKYLANKKTVNKKDLYYKYKNG